MYCRNCGRDVPDGSNFCPYCGFRLFDPQSADSQGAEQEQGGEGAADDQTPLQDNGEVGGHDGNAYGHEGNAYGQDENAGGSQEGAAQSSKGYGSEGSGSNGYGAGRQNTDWQGRSYAVTGQKDHLAGGLLAIFLGYLGIQYFYCGKTTGGLICIALSIVTCGVWSIVTFIQGIYMLTLDNETFNKKYVYSQGSFPLF